MKHASFMFVAAALAIGQHTASAGVFLGSANSFGVLAGSTVTNTGLTIVNGDVGVWPGSAVTGFPPGVIFGGSLHAGDGIAQQAQNDAAVAYAGLPGMASTQNLTGTDLGGLTLTPGVYTFASSAFLASTLTLDAQGDPNAVFVFQMGSTLITASGSSVLTINGADDCQIFWQVGNSATLGTGTAFQGNILALTSITMTTGATLDGRALALKGRSRWIRTSSRRGTSCPGPAPSCSAPRSCAGSLFRVGGPHAPDRALSGGSFVRRSSGVAPWRMTFGGRVGGSVSMGPAGPDPR